MVIRAARWKDLGAVVDLLGAQNRAVSGVAGIRAEHLRSAWSLPGFTLGEDNLVADDGGRAVGYAAVTPRRELVLAARDDTIADALLARTLARARGRGYQAVTVTVLSPESALAALVERHPFVFDRETILMWRPLGESLEDPRLPSRVALRTFEPADTAAVHRLLDEAYLGWDIRYIPMPHADWVAWMTGDSEFDASVWWLAERAGELVGCALHWSSGWLKDIAVAPPERGRGIGGALVQQGLAEFSRRSVSRVGLKVDGSNPTGAIRLYERLGFVPASRESIWLLAL
jgi:ribosomal protein S18 acetylase RimI-like enzyme